MPVRVSVVEGAPMEIDGGMVSTTHVTEAGEASMLPTPSTARTSNVWEASDNPEKFTGLVQLVKAPPSNRHWKPATPTPTSLPVKLKLAEVPFVIAGGWAVMEVSGGTRSIV